MREIAELEKVIEYSFKNKQLLQNALTHSSYANENRENGVRSYERLEFLGDSILGFVTAEFLYRTRPNAEGELTRMRASLVCEQSLARVAGNLGLSEFLRLGKGEESSAGRKRRSLIADTVEAIICAVYLDGGIVPASKFIHKFVLSDEQVAEAEKGGDYKTELQEYVQRDKGSELSYSLIGESGPDHEKVFESEAVINGTAVGRGNGRSKKEAEQAAARDALSRIRS